MNTSSNPNPLYEPLTHVTPTDPKPYSDPKYKPLSYPPDALCCNIHQFHEYFFQSYPILTLNITPIAC
jgi:hypothetical protein